MINEILDIFEVITILVLALAVLSLMARLIIEANRRRNALNAQLQIVQRRIDNYETHD